MRNDKDKYLSVICIVYRVATTAEAAKRVRNGQ